jgi:hypothetical protein
VSEMDITRKDLDTLAKEYLVIKEDMSVEWKEEQSDYEGRFTDYKNLVDLGGVKAYLSNSGQVTALINTFPPEIFQAFKEVYILTYMFNGQKAYYEYNNFDIQHLYVKDFVLTTEPQRYNYEKTKELITVIQDEKLNAIGFDKHSLSMYWFQRNQNNIIMQRLQNNINNFFKNIVKGTPVSDKIWTTYKEYKNVVKGKGYVKAFVPMNMRATNNYKNTTAVAYIANRYMNPYLKNFFKNEGIAVDEDSYALSELIQFIYRSAIRDGKPITVYVPSKRMRDLLLDWINKKDE